MFSSSRSVFLAIVLGVSCYSFASAQRSWDGGNGTFVWGDNGNWDPDGSPEVMHVLIGDLAAAANATTLLDTNYFISSLTISNGADVENSTDNGATTAFYLFVGGATTIANAGSSITIFGDGPAGNLNTDDLTISSQATLFLNSQTAAGTAVVEVYSAITNNANGSIVGNGLIELKRFPVSVSTLLDNEGTLTAGNLGFLVNIPPRTLQITAPSTDARVDLDGAAAGIGVVNVNTNATLDIDVLLSDAFGGDLNLLAGATLDISSAWTINGGTVDVNTPPSGIQLSGPPAHLAGGAITFSGGTITLNDDGDSLEIDSGFTSTGGVINNTGTMIFNSTSTIGAGTAFNMLGDADLVVNGILNIDISDFDLDGAQDTVTTINAGGNLDLDLGAGGDENFNTTINLNGGELDVTTLDNTWSLFSNGEINVAGAGTSTINGEAFTISGTVNVTDNSFLDVNTVSDYTSSANVVIAAGSTVNHDNATTFNGGSYTGDGVFRKGAATITADTTWDVGTVDLDSGNTTLNADLTINADAIDLGDDGVDLAITIADTALLTVNISGGGSWTLDPTGSIAYNGNASPNTYLTGSDLVMNGTINHTGDGRTDARLDILGVTGVVNILTAGEPLRLSGGNNTNDPNRIIGGTINGPGILGADSGSALHGYGTIDADIDFDGTANLKADDGVLSLTVGTAIIDVNEIGTADDDGTLSVGSPWNTNVAASVRLNGGQLVGAIITNDGAAGINGFGTLSAQVNNNTRIDAENGTLVVETPLNNNDWDGSGNTGDLNAISGDLEIRDSADFAFNGTVEANSGHEVFANGFELEFEPASTLVLNGGTYRSTSSTNIGGTVSVGGGTSTLQIAGITVFESGSSTAIAGELQLDNFSTRILSGATFSGGGTLVNPAGRSLLLSDDADVDVLLENDGSLASTPTAQTQGLDFEQTATGTWNVQLGGTGIDAYDRMTLAGLAALDGTLNLSLIGGYVPALSNTFNILSAVGGVTGSFDALTQPAGMPAGLFFGLAYQDTFAQLVVIDHLPGDYNKNGVVDAADYTLWRDTLGQVITALSGADGNGNGMVDASDYTFWKSNFGQTAAGSGTGSATSVPEPTTSVLLIFAAAGWSLRRRRAA